MVLLKPNAFLNNAFATRDDVRRGLTGLLDPLAAHTSPGGALIEFGSTATHYDTRAVAFETFARPLWGLTSLLAGGGSYDGVERWVSGLAQGTNPQGPEYWGAAKSKDQRMVEMSPMSFAIALAPEVFFDNQTAQAKENIAAFLDTCQTREMPDTNWLWFRVFANLALRTIKSPLFNAERMEKDLQRLDSFQLPPHPPTGDDTFGSAGWSRDGPEGVMQLDYYSGSFAIQFAQMVYAKLCAAEDPERAKSYRKRAQDFALDFIYYFDEEGNGIPFGRSMIYRFAIISTFSAMALCDVPPPAPLEWGHIKGLVLRHLRTWSARPEIFHSDGTLNIGYYYNNMFMTENYNSSGSPYWCCKAFACLGAKADHPFWTSQELAWPTELFPLVKALPDPHHIMVHSSGPGKHTFLLSSGQTPHYNMRHGSAKYSKFAYSSAFGFSTSSGDLDLEQLAADSMLAVKDASSSATESDTNPWIVRRTPLNARIVNAGTPQVHLRSSWKPFHDVEIETFLLPPTPESPSYYLQVHHFKTGWHRIHTAQAGWSLYGQAGDGRALVQAFSGETAEGGLAGTGFVRATTKAGSVGLRHLVGGLEPEGKLVQSDPNSNVIFSRSVLPTLEGEVEGDVWMLTAVFGVPFGKDGEGERCYEKEWDKVPTVPQWVFALAP